MVEKNISWDYALCIRGVTPKALGLAQLGSYFKACATLLGDENRPTFAGLVKGSAKLRVRIPVEYQPATRARLLSARQEFDPDDASVHDASAIKARKVLANMLAHDRLSAAIEDCAGTLILTFEAPAPAMRAIEPLVHDTGVIDGVVIALGGVDTTLHLRLLTHQGDVVKITLRDLPEARKAALHFHGDTIRAHVHGTWKRSSAGRWEPHALYLDRIEELSDESGRDLLVRLSALPGNRWSTMADPQALLHALRGDD